jgi:3-deoxy-manno-octulosonate cytidylyltransferase (CMP-KDO synthetase)
LKVLGIIPARYGSSRFPGKPLIDLKGKTMIQRVYEGAKKSTMLSDVIVATDDQRIIDAVESFGGKVMMTKDSHPSGTDRCGEIAANFNDIDMEAILNPNRIKVVVNHENQALYFSRSPIPNFANSKENPLTQYPYLRHIGLYAYRAETLKTIIQLAPTFLEQIESLEQLRWMYYGFPIKVVETDIETPNIDVPEDVTKVLAAIF